MDLKAGADIAAKWAAISYELHTASAAWSDEVDRRVKEELASLFLTEDEWDGDAPFTAFENPLLPNSSSYPGDDVLVQRVLFKVEAWSAPDIGGIARGFFSDDQTGWTTKPRLVLDFADVGRSPRLVAMHRPCPRCKTTSIGKTGGLCDYTSGSGVPCMDGLLFERGFIKAEIYNCDALFELKTEAALKGAGKIRIEGKEYVMNDGDVVHFRFNV